MPELLWKVYIDFEIAEGELERTRALYERLLDRTKHYKVWVSFAKFEASSAEQEEDEEDEEQEEDVIEHKKKSASGVLEIILIPCVLLMIHCGLVLICLRLFYSAIFDRANTYYKDTTPELKEERATLLEDWLNMETRFGKLGDLSVVQ